MAKVRINARHQRVAILEKEGYISRVQTYSKITGDEVVEYASLNSGINEAQLTAAMAAIRQTFQNFLINGHSVELSGIGIFRLGVNSLMQENAEDVSAADIKRVKVHYHPSTRIKALLDKVSFTTSTGDDDDPEPTEQVTLTLTAGLNGTVDPAGTTTYDKGTTVHIKAIPNTNYEFVEWSDGGQTQERDIVMDADTELTATFQHQ